LQRLGYVVLIGLPWMFASARAGVGNGVDHAVHVGAGRCWRSLSIRCSPSVVPAERRFQAVGWRNAGGGQWTLTALLCGRILTR
jgi:hypothetical protein